MNQKAKAIRKQDYRKHNDSCLAKVSEDEPIFVLRAQDIFSAILVTQWASLCESAGVNKDKVDGAKEIARQMLKWKVKKVPD